MNKSQVAHILGLEIDDCDILSKSLLSEVLENEFFSIRYIFNAGIETYATRQDFNKLDITKGDLLSEEDLNRCITQIDNLLWERAADEYLGRINSLVEAIKV